MGEHAQTHAVAADPVPKQKKDKKREATGEPTHQVRSPRCPNPPISLPARNTLNSIRFGSRPGWWRRRTSRSEARGEEPPSRDGVADGRVRRPLPAAAAAPDRCASLPPSDPNPLECRLVFRCCPATLLAGNSRFLSVCARRCLGFRSWRVI